MRLSSTIVILFLVLAGCDSRAPHAQQAAQPANHRGTPAAGPVVVHPDPHAAVEAYRSDNGMIGQLSRQNRGAAMPVVTFLDPAGHAVTLAHFAGHPVLVNLWATWCAPCKAEMPALAKLAARRPGGVEVVAISQDNSGIGVVRPWLAKAGLTAITPYSDPDNHLLLALGESVQLPTSILYDARGHEVWRMIGGFDWSDPVADQLIAEARGT